MPGEGFRCRQCGDCCNMLYVGELLEDHEFQDIFKWVMKHKQGRLEVYDPDKSRYVNKVVSSPIELQQLLWHYPCPFFIDDRKCDLHDTGLKPIVCQKFPVDEEHALLFCGCPGYDKEGECDELEGEDSKEYIATLREVFRGYPPHLFKDIKAA